jgi:large subunit ribosomal protein L4
MYRAAMRSVLSELLRQDRLVVVESLSMDQPKTSELAARLRDMDLDSVLILVEEYEDNLYLSARNLPNVAVLDLREINPVSLIKYDAVLATVGAVKALEERLS